MKYQYSKFFIISVLSFVFLSLSTLFAQEKPFNRVQPHLNIKEQLNNSFSDEQIHPFKRDMMNERQDKRFETRHPFRDDIQHWNGKHRRHFEVDINPITNHSPINAQMMDSVWVNRGKHTYTYDANGNMTEELCQYWYNNAWVISWEYTYTYNTNGNMTEELWQYWENNAWANSRKHTYTYDANGNMTEELWQSWWVPLAITDENTLPKEFSLSQNFPNPFNPVTTINYDLPEQSHVLINIYDILGREIRTIVKTTQDAGYKSVIWDGTDEFGRSVGTGIYLYQIKAGDFNQTKKMLLLR